MDFVYLFALIVSVHGTISVISEETNETVRVIYEKNIRAVSDAVEGYVIPANPLNACEAVDPAPVRKTSMRSDGNATTEETVFAFEDDNRAITRDYVLLSIVYDCDVTTKARNAQLGGYKALIIQNIGSNDSQHIPWHILRFPLVPHQIRLLLQRWLHPGKRRLTRPMLQLIPIKNWSRADPFQACAICQEDFKENDKIRVLPCLHGPCCMQRVRLPNDENDDDDEEETYPQPQRRSREGRSSSDQGCRITLDTATDGVGDPLLLELAQSPQARYHSTPSNPKSESPDGSCTITSPSESRKSSQDIKTLDWQLRRFLQNFNYTPSEGGGSEAGSNSRHGKISDGKLATKSKGKSVDDEALPSESTEPSLTLASSAVVAPRLLETCLDNSQSGSTDIRDNSTLEVLVGTVGTEDASYHLSSPYPATSNTFTISTTRDRKTSDATTISGSLPRDESSFHNADEIHSEIISEEVFDEVDDIKSTHSDQDTTQAAEPESSSAPTKVE
ncbi:E3 ubiquitin-protein ligase RNF13 [Orchesella cincta]|uniref:E3 ubiquitin-protein ligase RNF13 n=1 Tax=Orchesella cincta TaxID=48709 RepID=A0A1D2NEU3_ORCCI|nr:E3 ubiquitin-protein ligase RNF13 [Orchesella cincta]